MLLVTKSVGDWFGGAGIADEMIKFNGYPYLDKEEQAFHVSVSRVMKRDLETLPSTGMTVADIGEPSVRHVPRSPRLQNDRGKIRIH